MSKIKDILKDKNKIVVSKEEALKDVEPFLTEEELDYIIKNDIKIEVK